MKNKLLVMLLFTILTFGAITSGCGAKASEKNTIQTEKATQTETEVASEKIAQTETTTQTPVATSETATQAPVATTAPTPTQTTMYAQKYVNVRSQADTSATPLGHLSQNDAVVVVGDVSNGWYTVNYSNQTGYVKSEYLGASTVAVAKVEKKTASKKSSTTSAQTSTSTSTSDSGTSQTQSASNTQTTTATTPTTSASSETTQATQSTPATTQTPTTSSETQAAPTTPTMNDANNTMSNATGQTGHWVSQHDDISGHDVMVWVTD